MKTGLTAVLKSEIPEMFKESLCDCFPFVEPALSTHIPSKDKCTFYLGSCMVQEERLKSRWEMFY